jgi:hypothetical protein
MREVYKTLKAVALATTAIVVLTPPLLTISEDQNLTYNLSPSLLRLVKKFE